MKRHYFTIFLFCAAFAFLVADAAPQGGADTADKKGTGQKATKSPAKKGTGQPTAKSSATTVQWADLVNGGKLPYGSNVTLAGKLSDLTCGSHPISDVLDISAITVSYAGQTSPIATASIADPNWTAPLGSLSADTPVNLQLKVTANISKAKRAGIIDDLLADASFQASLKVFLKGVGDNSTVADFSAAAKVVLDGISGKSGPLTKILQNLLPSCVVVTEVTAAAVKGLQKDDTTNLLALPRRVSDFGGPEKNGHLKKGSKLDGYDPTMTAEQLDAFIKKQNGSYKKDGGQKLQDDTEPEGVHETQTVNDAADAFDKAYQPVLTAFGSDVIAQLSEGVALSQSSTTQDLNKYAGFDAGALFAPRINELRGFYMVHIYPTGPVELETSGHIRFRDRFSIAFGESTGDLSSNGASRVKSDKAFVYGLGVRINKYFRFTVGSMVYRDTVGNRLLNEVFLGPSIDITALPGLKSVFAGSSSKSTPAPSSSKSTKAPSDPNTAGTDQ